MFCSFFPFPPQNSFFKTTLGFSFFSVFHFNIVFFINPFWDIIIVSFLWLYLCCPLPFCVSASFLPTSFLPSPSPIHLAFILGRFALLFFLFARYCFQVWRFLFSFSCWFFFGFLLTVVAPFFITGVVFFVFLSVVFGCANVAKVVLVSAQGSFFKTTLGLSFSLILVFFCHPFQHSKVFFYEPNFWVSIVVSFLRCSLSRPSPFFVLASFLPTSFLPSASPIHLAFIFGRFALLFFLSSRCFFFRLGVSFIFLLLVFVWFAFDCRCHHFFLTGFFLLSFCFCCFWWTNCGGGWFRVIVLTYAKGVFPAVLVGFFENGWFAIRVRICCSLYLRGFER